MWILVAGLAACATVPRGPDPQFERDAIAARMMRDIEVLASDEFGGRKPGTPGGERTIAYVIQRMQEIGLESGTNDPGSAWRAPVELLSSKPLGHSITVRTRRGTRELPVESSAAYSLSRRVLIDGVEVVFLGAGSRALPESEITGRIVVLVQPQDDPAAREVLFAANPAAVLSVVPNETALRRIKARSENERLLLASEGSDHLTAFVTRDAFAGALPSGEWDRLMADAARPDFSFEVLRATIAIDAQSARREFTSSNVIGLIPGQVRGSGAVLLMAHWDHLGECAPGTPNPICNGAVDNASGVALMLELAQRLKNNGLHDRDIYFLATSAEEAGLLGARAFAEAPPIPLDSITASFNFDTVAVARAGAAVGFVGEGRTTLDETIKMVLSERGMELGNREFADSFLRRHDGWVLLERQVPSVLLSTAFSSEIVNGPFFATKYHRPSDEVDGLELGGAVDDLLLHEDLVTRFASTLSYPDGDTPASQ
ncbi:MAG: M20/M25/M40 family metallo-hydrolase [Pseudomonadota bacterium]